MHAGRPASGEHHPLFIPAKQVLEAATSDSKRKLVGS
jgi:hypothetical protein